MNFIIYHITEFDQCKVDDYESFLKRLAPLAQNVTTLKVHGYDGVASILSITAMCVNLREIQFVFTHSSTVREPLPCIMYFPSDTNIFNLTGIVVRSQLEPRVCGYNSQQQQQYRVNCSGRDLAFVINQSPYLEHVLLSCTGDNLDPSVIKAIAQLNLTHDLGLFYDVEPNHKDGALYSLLSKHIPYTTFGINGTSCLHALTLNVADDIILGLVSRMSSLYILKLTNGFNLVTSDGLRQFGENISYHAHSLHSLTLHMFDLRRPYGILNRQFASIPNLTMVNFTNCYVDRKSYKEFLDNAPSLIHVWLPLYSFSNHGTVQDVIRLKDTPDGRRRPFSLLHLDEMSSTPPELKMKDKRNQYVVVITG